MGYPQMNPSYQPTVQRFGNPANDYGQRGVVNQPDGRVSWNPNPSRYQVPYSGPQAFRPPYQPRREGYNNPPFFGKPGLSKNYWGNFCSPPTFDPTFLPNLRSRIHSLASQSYSLRPSMYTLPVYVHKTIGNFPVKDLLDTGSFHHFGALRNRSSSDTRRPRT